MGVAAAIAASLGALLEWHDRIPTAVTFVALAVLGAWYNSLQHEVIHQHPTPWQRFNTALAVVPLGLVVRFPDYRDQHLVHHRSPDLTDPAHDPESFYMSADAWRQASAPSRALHVVLRTLIGRLVLGPFVLALRHWRCGFFAKSAAETARRVVAHVAGVILVLLVVRSSGMPIWLYVAGMAWGGYSLSLLRSFAEHRYVDEGTRSAVVRSGWFFSLLFLNNNLHDTHHAQPWIPWYGLPSLHDELDGDRAAAIGAGLYQGYREVARRYLVMPFDRPFTGAPSAGEPGWTAATSNAISS